MVNLENNSLYKQYLREKFLYERYRKVFSSLSFDDWYDSKYNKKISPYVSY